jgi:hypothetical protein
MDDHTEIIEIEKRIKTALARMTALAAHVGAARQVKEFSTDQRKNALAVEVTRYIQRGESVAASETLGRSSPLYLEKLKKLEEDYKQAETVLAEWQITMTKIDSYRSMLAMIRETMHAGIAGGGF